MDYTVNKVRLRQDYMDYTVNKVHLRQDYMDYTVNKGNMTYQEKTQNWKSRTQKQETDLTLHFSFFLHTC